MGGFIIFKIHLSDHIPDLYLSSNQYEILPSKIKKWNRLENTR
jgi:hypothetical protein